MRPLYCDVGPGMRPASMIDELIGAGLRVRPAIARRLPPKSEQAADPECPA